MSSKNSDRIIIMNLTPQKTRKAMKGYAFDTSCIGAKFGDNARKQDKHDCHNVQCWKTGNNSHSRHACWGFAPVSENLEDAHEPRTEFDHSTYNSD